MHWMVLRRTTAQGRKENRKEVHKMRKLVMACAMLSLALGAWAASSIQIGDYTYYYNINYPDRKTVDLYRNNIPGLAYWIYGQAISPSPVGELVIPYEIAVTPSNCYTVVNLGQESFKNLDKMTSVVIPNTVTNIGYLAFRNCSSLTNVQFSAALRSIDGRAFMSCHSLEEVVLPEGIVSLGQSAFGGCKALKRIVLPDGLRFIGWEAFSYPGMSYEESVTCTNLANIVIPSTVTNIQARAFYGCKGLRTATIGGGVLGESAFSGCTALSDVTLGENVTSIGNSAFYGCTNLTEIVVPDAVTAVGNYAFSGCTNLTRVVFGSGVRNIGNYAFQGCTNLTEIVIPSSVTNIGVRAFQDCKSLPAIVVPDSVKTIGERAFYGCDGLESVVAGSGLTSLGKEAFYGCSSLVRAEIGGGEIGERAFVYCRTLKEVKFGNSVTKIGQSAFESCSSLTTAILPESIVDIGNNAFYDAALEQVNIPSGITNLVGVFSRTKIRSLEIPGTVKSVDSAFSGCNSLTNVVVQNGVEHLDRAFFACSKLASVTLPASLLEIGNNTFNECNNLRDINFPEGLSNIGSYAFWKCALKEIVLPDSLISLSDHAFSLCQKATNLVLGANIQIVGDAAFDACYPKVVTAYGPLPTTGADNLPKTSSTKKYVVTQEHLASWLPWLTKNKLSCAILDEETQQEVRVVVEGDGVEAVGLAASLGLSPARTTDAEGAVVTYAVPELSIEAFDPAAGCVEVLVTPAEGGAVTGDLVTDCVSVEWSDNISDWTPLSGIYVDGAQYRKQGTKGRFTCTFDASEHSFYKVKVRGQ